MKKTSSEVVDEPIISTKICSHGPQRQLPPGSCPESCCWLAGPERLAGQDHLQGPAAGVVGCRMVVQEAVYKSLWTVEMIGTSDSASWNSPVLINTHTHRFRETYILASAQAVSERARQSSRVMRRE